MTATETHITLSIDAMGGDRGAEVAVDGVLLFAKRRKDVKFLLFGEQNAIQARLNGRLKDRATIVGCDVHIRMDERPAQAVRRGRGRSGMWRSLEAVRDGNAQAAISAGNTGALMASATLAIGRLADVERPAIAATWPTVKGGKCVALDLGATLDPSPIQLADFAVMGEAMARAVIGTPRPKVGLLNIGSEDEKGPSVIREASRLLERIKLTDMDYIGFVEGDALGSGDVDVVVADGFAGNIALKTAEGTARHVAAMLRDAMNSSTTAKIGAWFAQSAFAQLRNKIRPDNFNGGLFLGLNGIVVKSHGSASPQAFANALDIAVATQEGGLLKAIASDIAEAHQSAGRIRDADAATLIAASLPPKDAA